MADKYSCTTDLVFTPLGSRLLLVTQGLLVLYAILLVSSIPLQINGGRADGEGRCEQKVDFVRDKTYYISRSLFFCHFSFQGTQRKHFKMVCVFNFFFRFHCIFYVSLSGLLQLSVCTLLNVIDHVVFFLFTIFRRQETQRKLCKFHNFVCFEVNSINPIYQSNPSVSQSVTVSQSVCLSQVSLHCTFWVSNLLTDASYVIKETKGEAVSLS